MLRPLQRAPTAEVEVSAEVRLWKLLVRVSTCLALKSYDPLAKMVLTWNPMGAKGIIRVLGLLNGFAISHGDLKSRARGSSVFCFWKQ